MSEQIYEPLSVLQTLLKGLVKHKASDLHLKVGRPPIYRVNGNLIATKMPNLNSEDIKSIAYGIMSERQVQEFEKNQQIDFGYIIPTLARFRANIFMQKCSVTIVIRLVPLEIPNFESLGLPSVVADIVKRPRGLLLITGATGSGKSTTMAALIDQINRRERCHIITIEDPIEFSFEDKLSSISQRELGTDAVNVSSALRSSLRQDPDVIAIGEMRDYETMQIALTAAETGHLVISTLHTSSAAQTIDRILDSFPPESKNQTRLMLASSIVGIVNQRLLKRKDGKGRVAACEVLVKSPTIEKLILENKISEIHAVLESSNVYYKMQSMNQSLEQLVRDGIVSREEAVANSDHREDLLLKLSGMVGGGHRGTEAGKLMSQNSGDADSQRRASRKSGIKLDIPEGESAPESGGYSKAAAGNKGAA